MCGAGKFTKGDITRVFKFPNEISEKVFQERYAAYEGESWLSACWRVSDHVAKAESNFNKWTNEFYNEISEANFIPGGRIWYGSGKPIGQLLNCFVTPTEDSREGWARSVGDNIIIAGEGGGNGENYSPIRPRGTPIRGTGGYATGSVSLMRIENGALAEIQDGGGRRAARMMALEINHGDIEEFINAKIHDKSFESANMSVIFMEDPNIFFDKVKNDQTFDLIWQGKAIKSLRAKDIWMQMMQNAVKNGEPGVLNGYLANKDSNIGYCRKLVCTNPCGEIWMQPYSTCCLASVNLSNFVRVDSLAMRTKDKIDWDGLRHTVHVAVRFLDDVLDVTHYPLIELKNESQATRRIGVGIMGLHHMLIHLGLKYSSEEGRKMAGRVMGFIKQAAYRASIEIAKEKGPFSEYRPEFLEHGFASRLIKNSLYNDIREHGIRNCALINVPPTGTTGFMIGTSTGLEPIPACAWERTRFVRNGTKNVRVKEICTDPVFEYFVRSGFNLDLFEEGPDIHPRDHLAMQLTIQNHVDNAVSKTINIPQGMYTAETLSDLYMEFLPQLKGITIYPEGSREFEPISRISKDIAIEAILNNEAVTETAPVECATGMCSV